MKDDYKKISRVYNLLSSVYSLGAVNRCREFVLAELKPGMKVCFLGVGQGREAVEALKMGAQVTVVDTSESMLESFQSRLDDTEKYLELTIHHGDVMDFCRLSSDRYDFVMAHFFLNVFSENKMPNVLENITRICERDGQIVIGDFWRDDKASKVIQWIQRLNWNLALFIFRRLANNPMHTIYVYDELLGELGFNVAEEKTFNVLGIPLYRSLLAKKKTR